jgi:tetratricopeptide (TPR) repeat protein
MSEILHATVRQLAHKIKDTKDRPRFAFFLGAGASRQSGIITAGEMIQDFKNRLIAERCPDEIETNKQKDEWLTEQEWYPKDGNEYCTLFEKLYPKEYARREYIERIIEGKEPSFGYAILANLIASNYTNTTITTNFDDLIYSACSIYTGIRSVVYTHGLLASEMGITTRPKILKLHGDYLYSALKNTKEELNEQDPNMKTQVVQVLSYCGLIVVGYSGGDESVMNVLRNISHKNDLYWCVQSDAPDDLSAEDLLNLVNQPVKDLLEEKRGAIIQIKGFDQMMHEVGEIVGFSVREMFGSIEAHQNYIIEKIRDYADNYAKFLLPKIVEALEEEQKLAAESANKRIIDIQCLDLYGKALAARDAGDKEKEEALYREIIQINPQYKRANNDLGIILEDTGRIDDAIHSYEKEIEFNEEDSHAYSNLMKLLRSQGKNAKALEIGQKALKRKAITFETFISLVGIHKALGNTSEADRCAAEARKLTPPDAWYHLASLECLSGNQEAAIENLKRAAIENLKRSSDEDEFDLLYARRDIDFESLRNDPRFKEIVADESR